MPGYSLNPYISFVESRLNPGFVQRAVFHRLTGELLEPNERVRALLWTNKLGGRISLSEEIFNSLGGDGVQLRQLVQKEFLIPEGFDPLSSLLDQYATRPIQNPSLAYRSKDGEWILIRPSMEHWICSPKRDELPAIIEERLSSLAAEILLMSDGTRTLRQIFSALSEGNDTEFRTAIDFLTSQERQLIKVTAQLEDLGEEAGRHGRVGMLAPQEFPVQPMRFPRLSFGFFVTPQ